MNGDILNMLREKLGEDKQKEYDAITAKIMEEIEKELKKMPKSREGQLDGPRSRVYRDVANKYIPELKRILEE